jgi:hypothetical protein
LRGLQERRRARGPSTARDRLSDDHASLRMTELLKFALLECGYQAESVLARGAEGVAGEQASEVDHFQFVAEVLSVGLKS